MLRLLRKLFRQKPNPAKEPVNTVPSEKPEWPGKKFLPPLPPFKPSVEPPADNFVWCLVGNIIDKRINEDGKTVYGTKHFSAGTKVYCFPGKWGDGYEKILVVGRHRKSVRNVCLVMPAKHIRDWRLKKVYHPHIMEIMREKKGWKNSNGDKNEIEQMVASLNWHYPRT